MRTITPRTPVTVNDDENHQSRGEYAKISAEKRKSIIRYWEDNWYTLTYKKIASDLLIRTSTLRNIVKIYNDEQRVEAKSRGGARNKIITPEMVDFIREQVDRDSTVTLGQLQEIMVSIFEPVDTPFISGIDYVLKNEIQCTLEQWHKHPER